MSRLQVGRCEVLDVSSYICFTIHIRAFHWEKVKLKSSLDVAIKTVFAEAVVARELIPLILSNILFLADVAGELVVILKYYDCIF